MHWAGSRRLSTQGHGRRCALNKCGTLGHTLAKNLLSERPMLYRAAYRTRRELGILPILQSFSGSSKFGAASYNNLTNSGRTFWDRLRSSLGSPTHMRRVCIEGAIILGVSASSWWDQLAGGYFGVGLNAAPHQKTRVIMIIMMTIINELTN